MSTENIQVDIADDGGSTRKLTVQVDALATSLDKAASAEQRAQTALAKTAQSAELASAANTQLAASTTEVAAAQSLLQRAGAGAAASASSLASQAASAAGASTGLANATNNAGASLSRNADLAGRFGLSIRSLNNDLGSYGASITNSAKGADAANAALSKLGLTTKTVSGFQSEAEKNTFSLSGAFNSAKNAVTNYTSSAIAGIRSFFSFGSAADNAAAATGRARTQVSGLAREVGNSLPNQLQNVTQQLIAFAGAVTTIQLVNLADKFNQASNQLTSFSKDAEGARNLLTEINSAIGPLGVTIDAQSTAFYTLASNLTSVGGNARDAIPVLQLAATAIARQGLDAAGSSAALIEFANAFKGGATNSQAMLTVLAKYPTLGEAVQKAMTGVSAAQVGAGAATERLASVLDSAGGRVDQFGQRLIASAAQIQGAYAGTIPTISVSFQALVNSLQGYIAQSAVGTAATNAATGALQYLAQNLPVTISLLTALGVAVAGVALYALVTVLGLAVAGFSSLLTVLVPAVAIVGAVAGGATVVVAAFNYLKDTLSGNAIVMGIVNGYLTVMYGIFSTIGSVISVVWSGLKSLADYLGLSATNSNTLVSAQGYLAQAFQQVKNYVLEAINAFAAWAKATYETLGIGKSISDTFNSAAESVKGWASQQAQAIPVTNQVQKAVANLNPELINAGAGFARVIDTSEGAANALGGYTQAANSATSATGSLSSSLSYFGEMNAQMRTQSFATADGLQSITNSAGGAESAIGGVTSAFASGASAAQSYSSSIVSAAAAVQSALGQMANAVKTGGTKLGGTGTVSADGGALSPGQTLIVGSGTNYTADTSTGSWYDIRNKASQLGALTSDGKIDLSNPAMLPYLDKINFFINNIPAASGVKASDYVTKNGGTTPAAATSTASTLPAGGVGGSPGASSGSIATPSASTAVASTPIAAATTGTLDVGTLTGPLGELASAAHLAALALNSIASAIAGQGVATFDLDSRGAASSALGVGMSYSGGGNASAPLPIGALAANDPVPVAQDGAVMPTQYGEPSTHAMVGSKRPINVTIIANDASQFGRNDKQIVRDAVKQIRKNAG